MKEQLEVGLYPASVVSGYYIIFIIRGIIINEACVRDDQMSRILHINQKTKVNKPNTLLIGYTSTEQPYIGSYPGLNLEVASHLGLNLSTIEIHQNDMRS